MDTPIADFVRKYCENGTMRLHMPGHKGQGPLGIESFDITEIKGADALYEASGIIEKSESNATALFGTQKTLYSTEGSSQCIRAMLFLAVQSSKAKEKPIILAARNVHKSFLYAGALLDFQVEWLYSENSDSICSCVISSEGLREKLEEMNEKPAAVYITSPDYLGGMSDIKALSEVCHEYGTFLLVDNAHGAYTKFLAESMHPMDLGADMCCDSAHKTLPVLTGGAYLHIGKNAPVTWAAGAKQAMALFGSTSPSYLILQSLDLCNKYLSELKAEATMKKASGEATAWEKVIGECKESLSKNGWKIVETDPYKITIRCDGRSMAEYLREANIECEYADPDYLVLMTTPCNGAEDIKKIREVLSSMPCERRDATGDETGNEASYEAGDETSHETDYGTGLESLPSLKNQQKISLRQAFFAEQETISVGKALGRICASPLVSCPPAIPIVVSGEEITEGAIMLFHKYGIESVDVVK